MFIVYILKNEDSGKIYIGQTENLEVRLLHHNRVLPTKKTSFTFRNKGVWKCMYKEKYITREETYAREKWLKSGIGREYIKKVLSKKSV